MCAWLQQEPWPDGRTRKPLRKTQQQEVQSIWSYLTTESQMSAAAFGNQHLEGLCGVKPWDPKRKRSYFLTVNLDHD